MSPNMKADHVSSHWQELADLKATNNSELDKIKYHLDLVLLALEAIADISSEAVLQAAKDLNLESIIGERITDLETSEPKHTSSADLISKQVSLNIQVRQTKN